MRQPQDCRLAGFMPAVSAAPNSEASSVLNPWLASCQLPTKLRRCGAYSTRNAVELPNSPPAEDSCASRAASTTAGASTPIEAYVGTTAMAGVASVISRSETNMDALRPTRPA